VSDPASQLRPALETWLRGDTEVRAAFGAKAVKVYKTLPPPNVHPPYIVIAGLSVDDDLAECMDNALVDVQLDVWSLTEPPGFAEAETIAAAVKASIKRTEDTGDSPAFTLADHRVVTAEPLSTNYLTDPSDGETVHAVILARLSVDQID
jgi:hypothetical protein